MNKPLTKAMTSALALLSVGPLKRNREGWVTHGRQFVALNTLACLRKRGLVRISADKLWAHPK